MSADVLRRAAALMRGRARLCSADGDIPEWYSAAEMAHILRKSEPEHSRIDHDAAHIASWHPAVALAVADWLDDIAERHQPDPEPAELVLHYDSDCPTSECEDPGYHTVTACIGCYPSWDGMDGRAVYPCSETKAALAVARAYLGEPS